MRAAPVLAEKTGGVAIVDHGQGVELVGEVADRRQVGDRAVHRKHAVGDNQPDLGVAGGFELRSQVGHIVVGIAKPLRLAEPDAVDDAGVVQGVADHGILGSQQGLKQAAVRVEA